MNNAVRFSPSGRTGPLGRRQHVFAPHETVFVRGEIFAYLSENGTGKIRSAVKE